MRSWFRRSAVLIAGAATLVLLGAPAALAHVTVTSTDAAQGGFGVITFLVPTESADASTTKLTVALPTDKPIAFVSVQPHPGWSFTVHRTKLPKPVDSEVGKIREVVDQVAWTADSAASAIKPGEFDQFNISAGPLPHVASLTLKAIQGYSDGSVVRWVEVAAPGSSAEPEHPAPVLELAAGESGSSGQTSGPVVSATAVAEDDGEEDDGTDTGTILGIIGIALGATALVLTLRRRPSR